MSNYGTPLAGKVAVITGGSQGVGLGIAEELIAQGARVAITGLDAQRVGASAAALGPDCVGLVADVRDELAMSAMYDDVVARWGGVDIVVANAVIGDSNPLGAITEAQFNNIFDTDVKGVLFTVQPAVARMSGSGAVVIISSTASVKGTEGMSLYGGAKAALRSMVRSWILELRGTGIRVNVLTLGAVDTPSLRTALADAVGGDQVDAAVARMGGGSPLGRLLQPREIGTATAFLASEASSGITGAELFVDGGLAQV
ncbi:SDR family oxidoreductase [Labedella populi]|uniref:SDR family oxidoreductase n=1 Tax=Labedella populi TaxID=2498850 RepID=A0A3S3ZVS6_9MICO|nr:SDR family NAD(P)-dependent oxidoreductase [Labedella populi]RWZ54813.1 SDR family oxidoreductase [Labedella populi]